MLRLFTSPLKPADFIIGYTLPLLPMSILRGLVCYAAALAFGLQPGVNLLAAAAVNIPIAVVFISLGLLFGSILNEKAVGGVLLTTLSAWLSNIRFDTAMVGGAFEAVANCLPFSHAASAASAFARLLPE